MPPKFKRHLNDDDVTGSVRSERRNLLEDDSDEEEDFFLRGPSGPRFGPRNDKIKQSTQQFRLPLVTFFTVCVPSKAADEGVKYENFSMRYGVQNQVDEVIDVMQENITKKAYRIMQLLLATDPSNFEGKCGGVDAK
nr:vesicle-associated membrane protein 4 isoform X5 [Loxodonta africana]